MALQLEVYKLAGVLLDNATEKDVTVVAKTIVRTVHPKSWETMGGNGTIAAVKVNSVNPNDWRLVVLSEHQPDVDALLTKLRN